MTQRTAGTDVAGEIKQFREALGLTQTAFAEKIGVTALTVRRWESGSAKPSSLAESRLQVAGFKPARIKGGQSRVSAGAPCHLMTSPAKGRRPATARNPQDDCIKVQPSPFVLNSPDDQTAFHQQLIQMQLAGGMPLAKLESRMSLAQRVGQAEETKQFQLEAPKPSAKAWNSNYGTHGWHRYVGRFPPHVIRALLNSFGADESTTVCDPFLGSGTTAVECRLLGIPFVGIEICPLSAMMARTKSAFPPDPERLERLAVNFLAYYDHAWSSAQTPRAAKRTHKTVLQRPGNLIPDFPNIDKWFTADALLGVSITVEFGMKMEGFDRDAVLLALSAKMRSIGNVDVDVVRAEYSKKPRDKVDVKKLVANQLTKMARDIRASIETHGDQIGPSSSIKIFEGSVLDQELAPGSISHVITSPPYGVEAISYLRTHLLSYRTLHAYLEHDPYETRDKTIGSEYLDESVDSAGSLAAPISKLFRAFFAEENFGALDKKSAQRRLAMMQFCDEMLVVGRKISSWLIPGGKVAFVIGNKRLGDRVIPMDAIICDLFAASGLQPQNTIRHKLKTNNSNSKVPWQDRIIDEESILLFEKTA